MALKRRFKAKKDIKVQSVKNKPTLKLIQGGESEVSLHNSNQPPLKDNKNAEKQSKEISLELIGDASSSQKKLIYLHKINNLYQDKNSNLGKLSKGLLEILLNALEVEGGSLWIFEEKTNELTCKVTSGLESKKQEGSVLQLGKGIVGWAAEKKIGTFSNDVHNDHRYIRKTDINVKTILAAPLVYGDEIIGVIELINKKTEDGEFTESDQIYLEDLTTPAAMHIKSNRIMKDQKDLIVKMDTFRTLHEVFSSTLDLDNLLQIVLSKALDLIRAEVGSIWLYEDNADGIECITADGPTKDKVIGVKLKRGVGIVGWVADNKEPIIVEDCSKDSRFSKAMDKKIGFVTESMICVPLVVKDESIGCIQVINKRGDGVLFSRDDMELLLLFAGSSAMYIKNAKLFASEKKAKELSALINISKEITSTLDIDAVLMSMVNLSANIIPFDESAISTLIRGKDQEFELRSISGAETVDREIGKNIELESLHNEVAKVKEEIYVSSRENAKTLDKQVPGLPEYMEKHNLQSFWAYSLNDDQGILGTFSMESKNENLINESKSELLSILISQSTVALRNAELYTTIPDNAAIGKAKEWIYKKYLEMKDYNKKQWIKFSSIAVFSLILLFTPILPYSVGARIEISPVTNTHYAQGQGSVLSIKVKEGQYVKKGDLLLVLDTKDLQMQLHQKISTRQKTITEMIKFRIEGKTADYKIKEKEKLSLDYEIALLEAKIKESNVLSDVDGVVVTANLDDLIGMPVNFGQELIKVANKNNVYIQFEVPEDQVGHIKPGQDVTFKVYGNPANSYGDGITIHSVGGEAVQITEQDQTKYFMAKAKIDLSKEWNQGLRPGMSGRGSISTEAKSLAYRIFSMPLRFISMELLF